MIREGIWQALSLLWELDGQVLSAAWISIRVSILAVAAASLVGVPIGVLLARRNSWLSSIYVGLFRVGMSIPTVLIGLVCFAMFARRGLFGGLELLYTQSGIVVGEFMLALPIIVTLTHAAISSLDPRVGETARTLHVGTVRRVCTYLNESRVGVLVAILTAFSRCFTELGIAMMVGGNLAGQTRTLTTAIALETTQGEFERGIAMSFILLFIAMALTLIATWFGGTRAVKGARS